MTGFNIEPDGLHDSGSSLTRFGDQIAQGGQRLQTAGDNLVEHAGRDRSGIGSVISKAVGRGLSITGKVFQEGGRVVGGAGQRLHTSADNYRSSDEHGAGLFRGVHDDGHTTPHAHPSGGSGGTHGGSGGTHGGGHVEEPPKPHGTGGDGEGTGLSSDRPSDAHATTKPPTVRCLGGDPVDVVTGEVVMVDTDVRLDGVLPLVLRRTHVSSYRSGRSFGPTWCATLDQRLVFDAEGVVLVADDGVTLVYPHARPGRPVLPAAGAAWPLRLDDDGHYRVADPDTGRTLDFGPRDGVDELPLRTLSDRNGNTVTLRRDATGTPVEVVHSGGYRVLVTSVDGLVTGLALARDPASAVPLVRFEYADRRLVGVVNSTGLPLRLEYDSAGRVRRWTDRNGFWYRYEYDDAGRCVRGEGPEGFLSATFDYDTAARVTTVTDAVGAVRRYHHNERGQVVRETDPLGNAVVSEWDARNRLRARTDPLGNTTRYRLDDRGDLVAVQHPDGTELTAAYNGFGQPVRITEPTGAVWRRDYDERGNLVRIVDPLDAVTTLRHDEHGALVSVVDALGGEHRFANNPAGLCVARTDPAGATTYREFDEFGRVVAVVDALGGRTRFGWTVEGGLAWRQFADDTRETWRHDGEGNLVEHVDPAGGVHRFGYAAFDALVWQVDPDGSSTGYGYDAELRLTSVTNPLGATWRYRYDAAGRLAEQTDFAGRTVRYTRDARGLVVATRTGAGDLVEVRRDVLGRVVRRESGGLVAELRYDPAGRLVQARTPDVESTFAYDPLGRVLAETTNGRTLTSSFDALGRRLTRRTPAGVVSTWTYDPADNPASVDVAGHLTRFEHDALGRQTRRHLGAAVLEQTWGVTHLLRTQALSVPAAGAARGPRLVQRRTYSYRADGYPRAVVDQLAGPREYTLDAAARVTAVSGSGWQERYSYDPLGNLTGATVTGAGPDPDAGPFEYAAGRLRAAGRTVFEYDDNGRVVGRRSRTLSGGWRQWRYEWDAADRLRSVVTPDGVRWRYHYDYFGRRVGKQRLDAAGAVVEQVDFTLDGTRLAEQVRSVAGRRQQTTWEWSPQGWQPLAQIDRTALRDAPQDVIDESFRAIVTDLVGTPCELVDETGAVTDRLVNSLWGTVFAGAPAVPFRFPGQYHDAETGLYYNVFRYYDPAVGRYYSPDPLGLDGGPNPDGYVPNPTCWADPLGLDKCLAASGTGNNRVTTMSGWKMPRPQGISHVDPQDVINLENQMGFPLKNGGAFDRGTLGKYFASHAERQATVLNPNVPVTVDKPMCTDCQSFFQALAQHRNHVQMVTDPDNHRIFYPNGQVETIPHNIPFSLGTVT